MRKAMQWEKEMDLAVRAARAAGERLKQIARGEKTVLSAIGRDVKLQADRDAEQTILEMIQAESPYPILAEESGEHGLIEGGTPYWVIDPLDGTANFSRGVPQCSVSVALLKGTEPLLGCVNDFNRDEIFYGVVGEGAWTGEGVPIAVSAIKQSTKAILATGFPVRMDMSLENLEGLLTVIRRFKKIRMIGTAALSLAYVAAGRFDAYREEEIMLWDVAAGLALIKAAGGVLELEPSPNYKWAYKVRCAANAAIWTDD